MYNNPTPVNEAFQENGVWKQDYNVFNTDTGKNEVKRFMYNGTDWVPDEPVKLDLTKKIPQTAAGVDLRKHVEKLDECLVDLTKRSGVDLQKHRARVCVVMDYSGSMSLLYKKNRMTGEPSEVQNILTRLFPLSLRFDDNGELEVWLFHNNYRRMEAMTLDNFDRYVEDVILTSGERMGGTSYSPVIRDMLYKYFTEDADSKDPVFVIFITDGENSDHRATDDIIRQSAEKDIFIQFVGIGRENFNYLRKIDDLTGRRCDNTGFEKFESFGALSNNEVFSRLLAQYTEWLKTKP